MASDNHRKDLVSARIRERLEAEGRRYFANDNIADMLQPGELEGLHEEAEAAVEDLLDSLVIDWRNDHNSRETARRVAKMYLDEVFAGRYNAQPATTEFPNAEAGCTQKCNHRGGEGGLHSFLRRWRLMTTTPPG